MEHPNNKCMDGEPPTSDIAPVSNTSVAQTMQITTTPEPPTENQGFKACATTSMGCQTEFLGIDANTQTESLHYTMDKTTNTSAFDEDLLGLTTNHEQIEASKVITMSWNSTALLLAIGYTYQHKPYCNHSSWILVFSMVSVTEMVNDPVRRLRITNCPTNVCFHPKRPYILAVSSFIGDIYLWNIEPPYALLLHKQSCHKEFVTHLAWICGAKGPTRFFLASSSADGFLKVWNPTTFQLKEAYKFRWPLLQSISIRHRQQTSAIVEPKPKLNVLAFDFSIHSPEIFVVGLVGGLVVQCNSLGAIKLQSGDGRSLFDAIVLFHKPLKEEIGTISILTHRKDTFLVAGTGKEIRLYIFGRSEPVQLMQSHDVLKDVVWVRVTDKLVAACSRETILEHFRLFNDVTDDPLSEDENLMDPNNVLIRAAVKPGIDEQLPQGCKNGKVQFWSIAWGAHRH